MSGMVVWEGRSRFDGSPIVVVLTDRTDNKKTGPMIQSWILRSDMPPTEAVRSGADVAICGSCPRSGGSGCYVTTHTAPLAVFRSLPRYERVTPEVAAKRIAGWTLRIGAYGDPAAVPASVWWALVRHTRGQTGYTHSPHMAPALRGMIMASVDSPLEAVRWQAHGWRTFRVRSVDADGEADPMGPGESVCPASAEGGMRTACAFCLLCDGAREAPVRSIAVIDHAGHVVSRLARLRRSREGVDLNA